jgi:L-threonylcarbamoyladenylate synthase
MKKSSIGFSQSLKKIKIQYHLFLNFLSEIPRFSTFIDCFEFNTIMEHIIEVLKSGGTILYPTDTIWGIGCDATNIEAVNKIFDIKKREKNKSMIILVESEKRLQDLVDVPEMAWEIIDLSEKPVTIVYENPRGLPKELLAEDGSIGIRLVKNDFCKKLITKLNKPLVSTSANFSGEKSPLKFSDISNEMISLVDYAVEEDRDKVSKYSGSSVIKIWSDNRIKVLRE